MGKKATKAAGNVYYDARSEAAEFDTIFASRESASEVLNIERTRLANIELGNITPYPEEVKRMSKEYNTPELCNSYCANECPIGKGTVTEVKMDDFDRLSLKVLGSLKDIDYIRTTLIDISEDGIISKDELKNKLNSYGIILDNDILYDANYVYSMCLADFYKSSIQDERLAFTFVKDMVDDADAVDGFIFNRWYADMNLKGMPIDWESIL